ncbi:MAG: glutathione S-transferase family protein [bacterium]
MLVVYHLEGSRSDRLLWLLEELGLDYHVEAFERDPQTQRAPAAMKALHPMARAPMLRDGEILMIESGAIFEYVLARHGGGAGLVPEVTDPDWPDYLQWLHFAEGSAMLPILLDHFHSMGLCGEPGEAPIAAVARSELDRLHAWVESVLALRPWLAGDRFTAADVMMGWVIELIDQRGEIAPYPALARYVEAIRARPAHRRARERASGESGG